MENASKSEDSDLLGDDTDSEPVSDDSSSPTDHLQDHQESMQQVFKCGLKNTGVSSPSLTANPSQHSGACSSEVTPNPAALLEPGDSCLAVWAEDSVLYRAELLGWQDEDRAVADVLFVDFENVETVEVGDMFYSFRCQKVRNCVKLIVYV